ncbi:MAG: sialidase family protein [Acidobacteriaceae bacterium]
MKKNQFRFLFVAGTATTILSVSGLGFAQNIQSPPHAPQAEVTTLTMPGSFSEPSVAVNPANPRQVVVAYQNQASIAYSRDAGAHWQAASNTAPRNFKVSGDVSVTYDKQGHAILCYIAFDKLGTFNYWGHAANTNGIFIHRSLDGGKTWEPSPIIVSQQEKRLVTPFEDKPYIVADTSRGPHAGNLYIAWTRWGLVDSRMVFSRSTDDGKTWTTPMEIDQHPGLPRDDNGALEGFDGVVGADSTLYAVWSYGDDIQFTTSHDGGKSFSKVKNILRTAPTMFAVQDFQRGNGFPQIAVDARSGKTKHARLYVTWSDYRNGDIDVFCASSQDGGKHWSAPVRVNDDPVHDGADQFFQWLTVDPVSGAVSVIFYDRRADPENRKTLVTLARSTDGGKSFVNYGWSRKPFVASDEYFMGDYSGIASYNDRVYGAWTEAISSARRATPTGKEKSFTAKQVEAMLLRERDTIVRVGVADFSGTDGRTH